MWSNNLAVVQRDRIFRSGQMPAGNLARAVRDHRIKTVLNLRGANPEQAWYPAERATTLAAGATQVDLSMASDMWLSRNQARTVINVLDTCSYPVLIHCQWGAERTGLVSAIAELLRPGGSLADARRQFSLYYLYIKAGDGAVMERHLDRYEQWLQEGKLAHAPEQFRRWIAHEFRPESPSREEWPYDPYPPVIITRPGPHPATSPTAQLADEGSVTRK
jgi:protein tyrosine/serine phosphatase